MKNENIDICSTPLEDDGEDLSMCEDGPLISSEKPCARGHHSSLTKIKRYPLSCYFWAFAILTIVNLALAGYTTYSFWKPQPWGISPYTGLGYDTPYKFEYFNDYWGNNETLSDQLWSDINTDSLVVALSPEYQTEHDLPESTPFPWDPSKGLYYLKSVHLLHCLKHLRRVITDYQRYNTTSLSHEHSFHCLDIYRQYTLCHADDTPMAARYTDNSLGDGQMLQCRSMDKLSKWVAEGDRNACFRMVDDFGKTEHALEKYQYCEEDSPYYSTMMSYFQTHGHQNLFVGESGGHAADNTEQKSEKA